MNQDLRKLAQLGEYSYRIEAAHYLDLVQTSLERTETLLALAGEIPATIELTKSGRKSSLLIAKYNLKSLGKLTQDLIGCDCG